MNEKENEHQKIIEQIKEGNRYITNLTKGTIIKVEFNGKKMFLKEGQAIDVYTGKKVDFLKKHKEREEENEQTKN